MTLSSFIILHILVAIGSYIQVTAGFAFGLIFMAGIGLFDIMPLEQGAMIGMLLGLINTLMALKGQNLSMRQMKTMPFIWFSPIGCILGLYLLYLMIDYPLWYNILYMLLGVFVIIAALSVMIKPAKGRKKNSFGFFSFFMFIGGIFGGLFCTSGPPIIYALYSQPWCLRMLRRMTLTLFAIGLSTRAVLSGFYDGYTTDLLVLCLSLLPTVYVATLIARKYVKYARIDLVRKIICALLIGSGIHIFYKTSAVLF